MGLNSTVLQKLIMREKGALKFLLLVHYFIVGRFAVEVK
jgi:hypothetical protein